MEERKKGSEEERDLVKSEDGGGIIGILRGAEFQSFRGEEMGSRRESLMGSRANPLCRLPAFDDEIH